MTTWAIVPVKPFNRSKSRLSGVLTPPERESLSRSMLEHTLTTLAACEYVSGVLVISRDPAVVAVARALDVHTVQESGAPELNAALTRAMQVVSGWGARRVLILPSDLPLLEIDDLDALLDDSGHAVREVVLAPDRREDGTNALVMKPPGLLDFGFGTGSFARHRRRALAVGAQVRVYLSPTIGLDVDLPEDLELYRSTTATAGSHRL